MTLLISRVIALPVCLSAALCLPMLPLDASAQQSNGPFSAAAMWGVSAGSTFGGGATSDGSTQTTESTLANAVSAAKLGIILNQNTVNSVTIQSIGSQSVVSNNIVGNGNSTSISASQSASNSGTVTNSGSGSTK